MEENSANKIVDWLFHIGIWTKCIVGLLEILAGVLLWIFGAKAKDNLVVDVIGQEVAKEPSRAFLHNASPFAIFYLIFHGLMNIFLVVVLLRNKTWGYFVGIFIFFGFIIYQIYEYLHTHSIFVLLLTIFDIFLVIMVWLEYKKQKNHLN